MRALHTVYSEQCASSTCHRVQVVRHAAIKPAQVSCCKRCHSTEEAGLELVHNLCTSGAGHGRPTHLRSRCSCARRPLPLVCCALTAAAAAMMRAFMGSVCPALDSVMVRHFCLTAGTGAVVRCWAKASAVTTWHSLGRLRAVLCQVHCAAPLAGPDVVTHVSARPAGSQLSEAEDS